MRVAEKYGEKGTRVPFSNNVLIELSRPATPETAQNMMNIATNFKSAPGSDLVSKGAQNLLAAPSTPELAREKHDQKYARAYFSNRVLTELSRPATPESARQEADEHEKLTGYYFAE